MSDAPIAHRIHLGLKPIAQGRARVGRWSTYYPKTSQQYRRQLVAALADYPPIPGPVAIEVELAGCRANSDLDNHLKMILDALQDARVIESDDVRTVRHLSASVVPGDPGTTINIRSLA
jgi:Holliday junction resolvase RusA-like endonuclease